MVNGVRDSDRSMCGFLGRLRRDARGNTLAIVAASILPLVGMIGGAVDISRLYLTRTRMQQACDAGALAGRKSMSGLTWTTTAGAGANSNESTAKNFFNTNFPDSKYGTNGKTVAYSASSTGAVTGTASVVVPMTLMSVFKMPARTISVTCKADLQLPNTDVMFVLDTTLSMDEINSGDTDTKLQILKTSVTNFYNQLESVKAAGSSIRYGFVPYSNTVNVGLLLKREWMVDSWTYQSRIKDIKDSTTSNPAGSENTNTDSPAWNPAPTTFKSTSTGEGACVAPSNNYKQTNDPWSAWTPDATSTPRSRTQFQKINGTTYSASLNTTTGVCTVTTTVYDNATRTVTQTVTANANAGNVTTTYRYWFNYQPVEYNVSSLKGSLSTGLMAGGTFSVPNFNAGPNTAAGDFQPQTMTWGSAGVGACIEERSTLHTDELFGTAYDMDVDMIPNPANPATQWRPAIPRLVYARSVGNFNGNPITGWTYSWPVRTTSSYASPVSYTANFGACPAAARKLSEITSAQLSTYLGTLKSAGHTYHDIGFLWGLRLISAQGLFASENLVGANGGSIARHIIFMTDGATETNIADYDAYGIAALDRRRTANATTTQPTDAAQDAIVEDRLGKLCTIAKNDKNITVWVIAFGTTLTQLLTDCASPGRAYQANNAAELATTFSQIASQIAQLRLVQ